MIELLQSLYSMVDDLTNHLLPNQYTWFVLIACAFYVGMTKGGIGNGLGSLSIIFLTVAIDPLLALAISLPIFIIADCTAIFAWWGKWHIRHAIIGLIWCSVGIVLGYFFLLLIQKNYISTDLLRLLLGSLGLFVSVRWLMVTQVRKKELVKFPPLIQNLFAVLCGFASTTLSFGGIFLISYVLNLSLKSATIHATTILLSTNINLIRLLPYSALDLFNQYIFIIALLLAPFVLLGVQFGRYIHNRMSYDMFVKIAYLGVFVASSKILFDLYVG